MARANIVRATVTSYFSPCIVLHLVLLVAVAALLGSSRWPLAIPIEFAIAVVGGLLSRFMDRRARRIVVQSQI